MDDARTALAPASEVTVTPAPGVTPAPVRDPALDVAAPAAPDRFSFTAAPTAPEAPPADAGQPRARRTPVGVVWGATALAVVVLTGFFVLVVSGRVVTEGPVVLVLSRTHGIHLGDLFALGAWCLAVGALVGAAVATALAARR